MTIHHSNLIDRFTNGTPTAYAKTGEIKARLSKPHEHIITSIEGKVETTNTAKAGEVVVTGPKGESYLVERSAFNTRYQGPELSSLDQTYQATGKIFAVRWDEPALVFTAPWGEDMIIEPGDYLASLSPEGKDAYRIEAEAFALTYKLI